MNSELKDILERMKEFKQQLTDELKGNEELIGLEDELKTLEEEFKKGKLSVTSNARHNRISKRIQKINKLLEKIEKVEKLEEAKKLLAELSSKKVNERSADIQKIADTIKRDEKPDKSKLAKALDVEEKDLDIAKTKDELEKELEKLNADLETLKKHGRVVIDLEIKIERIRVKLEKIEDYLGHNIDEKTIKAELNDFAKKTTSKEDKEKIANKYNALINDLEIELLNELEKKKLTHINIAKNKKEFKERFAIWWDKYNKLVLGLIGTTVLIAAIATSCKNNQNTNANKKPNNDSKNPTNNSTNENTYTIELRNTLISLGYNEYYATQYAAIPEFDINDLEYYELTQQKYQITMETAVDYVNRAKEIQKTNFFEGALLEDIIDIVSAIDNKDLQTTNNANLAQMFNTSFNVISNNVLFGATTEEDVNSLDVLNHLARKDSDMDQFLSGFRPLSQKILQNPNDLTAKQDMYNYLNIFATSLNGFTNDSDALNNNNLVNEKAQVADYYDWYIIYNSFIAPMYPTFVPERTNEANEEVEKLINAYEELQVLLISGLQGPEFEILCGQSRNLD